MLHVQCNIFSKVLFLVSMCHSPKAELLHVLRLLQKKYMSMALKPQDNSGPGTDGLAGKRPDLRSDFTCRYRKHFYVYPTL